MNALGRRLEHDERSWNHPFSGAMVALRKLVWRRYGKILDQGDLGSCTGNAAAGAINTRPLHIVNRTLTEKGALALYERATVLDGFPGSYPPDDTGSSGIAVAKAAKEKGYISSYQHAFSVTTALQALMYGPVITGVNWYEGFDHPDAYGVVKIAGQVRGGHEFVVRGYDPATDLVTADNSWGTSWGVNGHFHFTSATWAELLSQQGDVTVLLH